MLIFLSPLFNERETHCILKIPFFLLKIPLSVDLEQVTIKCKNTRVHFIVFQNLADFSLRKLKSAGNLQHFYEIRLS